MGRIALQQFTFLRGKPADEQDGGTIIRLKDEVRGVLMLAGALGGDYAGFFESIHPLSGKDRLTLLKPLQCNGEIIAPGTASRR